MIIIDIRNFIIFQYIPYISKISEILGLGSFVVSSGEATRLLAEAGPWLGFGCFVGARNLEDFQAEDGSFFRCFCLPEQLIVVQSVKMFSSNLMRRCSLS